MEITFNDKVTLVTGAASGMGLAASKAFAEAGGKVVMADSREEALATASESLKQAGHTILAVRCDVTNESDVKHMLDQTLSAFDRLDAAYNNAGIQSPVIETADVPTEEFDRVNSTNLRGIFLCMKYELQQMRKQESGAIVNCSSMGGLIGIADRTAYHASKHGVLGLTKSSALEYAARGIRINAVCPGIIKTPMVERMLKNEPEAMDILMKDVPIARLGMAEEVANTVLWLCSPLASYIIGQAISVDGGYTIR